ncbi:hypothetical protein Pcinc_018251 [Petrolisthes cinctipes]|uniref:Uncharacterized protein n=1 Tax=Petrolisthes cinctipes TaxID=88211 RepID=A0AAE1KJF2_PETCI|nr:hypothetical protein Pcinc_018251 [Petrolisthes cinctipes]
MTSAVPPPPPDDNLLLVLLFPSFRPFLHQPTNPCGAIPGAGGRLPGPESTCSSHPTLLSAGIPTFAVAVPLAVPLPTEKLPVVISYYGKP